MLDPSTAASSLAPSSRAPSSRGEPEGDRDPFAGGRTDESAHWAEEFQQLRSLVGDLQQLRGQLVPRLAKRDDASQEALPPPRLHLTAAAGSEVQVQLELSEIVHEAVKAGVRKVGQEIISAVADTISQSIKPIVPGGIGDGHSSRSSRIKYEPNKSISMASRMSPALMSGVPSPNVRSRNGSIAVATPKSQSMAMENSSMGFDELCMIHHASLIAQDVDQSVGAQLGKAQQRYCRGLDGGELLGIGGQPHPWLQGDGYGFDMNTLRVDQEKMIVESNVWAPANDIPILSDTGTRPRMCLDLLVRVPSWALCLFGVVPAKSRRLWRCYSNAALLVVALAVTLSAVLVARKPDFAYTQLIDTVYGLGGLLALCTLRHTRIHDLVGSQNKTLELYSFNHAFQARWMWKSQCSILAVAGLWLCELAIQACLTFKFRNSCMETAHDTALLYRFIFFVLVSGLFCTLTCIQLHICHCLNFMVDEFNLRFFRAPNIERGIHNWNVVQAILRRATHVIDTCFLAMMTLMLVALVLICSDVLLGRVSEGCTTAPWFVAVVLPLVLKFIPPIYLFYLATSVTEKCHHTPALINSVIYGDACDGGRQYLVQYIRDSAAGFYVKGVRVTAYMLIKCGHVLGMLTFTCMARMSQIALER